MNVEIGAEAALFPEKEYIKGIAVAMQEWWRGWGLKGVAETELPPLYLRQVTFKTFRI
jgi:hypothetical protein